MYFSDSITLRSVVVGANANGYPTATNTDTAVWANRKSVSRSEFYAANANKINVVNEFEVHVEDWNNQTQILDGSDVYYIVRSYQKGLGLVALVCSDKAV